MEKKFIIPVREAWPKGSFVPVLAYRTIIKWVALFRLRGWLCSDGYWIIKFSSFKITTQWDHTDQGQANEPNGLSIEIDNWTKELPQGSL